MTAKDSIEEVMNEMNVGRDSQSLSSSESETDKAEKYAKMHTLLKRVSLIKPRIGAERKHKRKASAVQDGRARVVRFED